MTKKEKQLESQFNVLLEETNLLKEEMDGYLVDVLAQNEVLRQQVDAMTAYSCSLMQDNDAVRDMLLNLYRDWGKLPDRLIELRRKYNIPMNDYTFSFIDKLVKSHIHGGSLDGMDRIED